MAKAYFIGGAPRAGKTTLTLNVVASKPMLATSTDAIRYMLRRIISEQQEPKLFQQGRFTSNVPERRQQLIDKPQEAIEAQNEESRIVWHSVVEFVKSNLADGFDILIEGVAILPEQLANLDFQFSAVFMGNQSSHHAETMIRFARNNQHDWLSKMDDETIHAFAAFNQKFSKYISDECNKYQLPYIEVIDGDFTHSLQKAQTILLN